MRRSTLRAAGSAKPLGRVSTFVSSSSAAVRSFASVRDPGAKVCFSNSQVVGVLFFFLLREMIADLGVIYWV